MPAQARQPSLRVAACLILALQIAAAIVFRGAITITGDEPHYLMVTRSVLQDGDFDVANQYADGNHRAIDPVPLSPVGATNEHRGDGRLYHVRLPGQSLLILPAYALGALVARAAGLSSAFGGYWAAVSFLVLLTSLFWALLFRLARDLTGSAMAALVAVLALSSLLPIVPYGSQIYPEMTAALTTLAAMWAICLARPNIRAALVGASAIGILASLHQRFAIVALALAAAAVLIFWRRNADGRTVLMPFLGVLGLFAAAISLYSQHAFGSLLPSAGWNQSDLPISRLENLGRGLALLFLDDGRGLLSWAPHMLLIVALWIAAALRGDGAGLYARVGLACFLVTAITSATTFGIGRDIPPRHLVSVLPLAAFPLAVWLASPVRRWLGPVLAIALLPGALLTTYGAADVNRLLDASLGNRAWIEFSNDLHRAVGIDLRVIDLYPAVRPFEAVVFREGCQRDGGVATCPFPAMPPPGSYEVRAYVRMAEATAPPITIRARATASGGKTSVLATREVAESDPDGIPRIVAAPNPPSPLDPILRSRAIAATGLTDDIVVATYREGAAFYLAHRQAMTPRQVEEAVQRLAGARGVPPPQPGVGTTLLSVYAEVAGSPLYGVVQVPFDLPRGAHLIVEISSDDPSLEVGGYTLVRTPRWAPWK